MNNALDYAAVLKKALSSGGEFAEIFIERSAPFSIVCEDSKIEKVVSGLDHGAGVRLIFGQRTAYAYTNELTTESLLEIADAVRQAATKGARGTVIDLTRKRPRTDFSVLKSPRDVETSRKVEIVLNGPDRL
jgi:TldD protein